MSEAVVVELIGGPFDGQQLAVPALEDGSPGERVLVLLNALSGVSGSDAATVGVLRSYYDLRLSAREHGPLWEYVLRQ
jgi:hypothetical protein